MSLDVALQSVAFYVLSCSTCAKINHRRKAKIQAKRERAEKHELETEQPGLYRHPSPFNTNPYWTEEILMGPGPPKKNDKSGSKNGSQRALNTAGQGSSYAGSLTMSSEGPGSPTAVTEGSRVSGDGWNRKRYQREDEALWGHDFPGPGQRIMDAIAKAGSSAGRLLESRLSRGGPSKEEENPHSYYLAKNPPVNDLHPPVVSTAPSSRDETRWMLQPPPSAKVMEGKERVNRSRAGSNGSRRAVDSTPLSRQVTERLVDAKIQRGEVMTTLERNSLTPRAGSRSRSRPATQPNLRRSERSSSTESGSSSDTVAVRRRRKLSPIFISTSGSGAMGKSTSTPSETTTAASGSTTEMREQPSRPMLSTILSSSNIAPQFQSQDQSSALLQPSAPLGNYQPQASSSSHRTPPSVQEIDSKFSTSYRSPQNDGIENVRVT